MATEDPRKKIVPPMPLVGIPPPLPMMTAGTPPVLPQVAPPAVAPPIAATAAPPVPTPGAGQGGGAVFGIYPVPGTQFSTNLNDAALRRGVSATGPSTFVPAQQPSALTGQRMNAQTDPRSMLATTPAPAGIPGPVGMPAAPVQTMPPVATTPLAPNPVVAAPADPAAAGNAAPIPAAPALAQPPTAQTQPDAVNGSQERIDAMNRDTAAIAALSARRAAQPDPNQLIQGGGGAVIGTANGLSGMTTDQRQQFFDEANLRSAAAKGSWSPRKGYQGDQTAIDAAKVPIINRQRQLEVATETGARRDIATQAQAGETARLGTREAGEMARLGFRDAGETARLAMREAGDTRRSSSTDELRKQALDIQRGEFGLKQTAAGYDNATRERLAAAQKELQVATTPEQVRAATQKVAALSGRELPNRYTVVPGGQAINEAGVPYTQQAQVLDNQSGAFVTPQGATAGIPKPGPAEGSISTVNGKSAKFVGGKWVPL